MARQVMAGVVLLIGLASPAPAAAGCHPIEVTRYSPTGIAGCAVFGEGIASHYGPGDGVATNWCTWERRHRSGCGSVTIMSVETGITVTAEVIDFCDCYVGTKRERIVDLQWDVLEELGLDRAKGLYPVVVQPVKLIPDTGVR